MKPLKVRLCGWLAALAFCLTVFFGIAAPHLHDPRQGYFFTGLFFVLWVVLFAAWALGSLWAYFKRSGGARGLPARTPADMRGQGACDGCDTRYAVVFCLFHRTSSCFSCLPHHDDGKVCSYVPAWRAAFAGRVHAPSPPAVPAGRQTPPDESGV